MGLAVIDIIFLVIIGIFALRCGLRGIVSELMSMAALVLGLLAAIFFFRKTAELIRGKFIPDVKALPEIISFVAIFIAVFAIMKILETILKEIIIGIKLGGPDRFLGFFLGIAEGLVVVCLLLFLISVQPFVEPAVLLEGSLFADILMPFIIGTRKELMESVARFGEAAEGGFARV
ncbi:MAG: CvpA family protein [Treponema sp.]|jgi:membrane protein required for colicin V production|nr:CvpA family protein [Treponema sp.]